MDPSRLTQINKLLDEAKDKLVEANNLYQEHLVEIEAEAVDLFAHLRQDIDNDVQKITARINAGISQIKEKLSG